MKRNDIWQHQIHCSNLRKLTASKSHSPISSDNPQSKNSLLVTYEINWAIFCENDLKLSLFPSPYLIEIHLIVLDTPVRHIMFNGPLKFIDYHTLLFEYYYWQESTLHINQGEIFSCFSCFFFC